MPSAVTHHVNPHSLGTSKRKCAESMQVTPVSDDRTHSSWWWEQHVGSLVGTAPELSTSHVEVQDTMASTTNHLFRHRWLHF